MFAQSSNFREVICGVIYPLNNEYTIDCGLLGCETSLGGYRRFGGTCCLELQGRNIGHGLNIFFFNGTTPPVGLGP
jgi:hypothetical protein